MYKFLFGYLVIINLLAFIIYGWDKRKARKGEWRIKESTLLLLALLFGSIGALAGMLFFHHKTKKIKFIIPVPLMLCLQIYLLIKFVFAG